MAMQPTLNGLEFPEPVGAQRPRRDPTIAEITSWCRRQLSWIARRSQADKNSELFLYTQAAKLVEEVGELHAQLLGRSKLQRLGKLHQFGHENLEGEFADVMICTLILAEVAHIDVVKALRAKMDVIDRRVAMADNQLAGAAAVPPPASLR